MISAFAPGVTLSLVRRFSLSTCDDADLALALGEHVPLATLDEALRKAARPCNVSLA